MAQYNVAGLLAHAAVSGLTTANALTVGAGPGTTASSVNVSTVTADGDDGTPTWSPTWASDGNGLTSVTGSTRNAIVSTSTSSDLIKSTSDAGTVNCIVLSGTNFDSLTGGSGDTAVLLLDYDYTFDTNYGLTITSCSITINTGDTAPSSTPPP